MIFNKEQQQDHERVMRAICESFLKNHQPMVLKGGTALRFCYNLDRFSEDLDFDSAKPLNLEHSIRNVFISLGKGESKFRNPDIELIKNTHTVRRYRVRYADAVRLKIETSLRGTPDDSDLIIRNGILTYKIRVLISQKMSALQNRTAARDFHDVVFLYERYFDDFDDDHSAVVADLNSNQSEVLSRFNTPYSEDSVLDTADLISDLYKLKGLVDSRDQ